MMAFCDKSISLNVSLSDIRFKFIFLFSSRVPYNCLWTRLYSCQEVDEWYAGELFVFTALFVTEKEGLSANCFCSILSVKYLHLEMVKPEDVLRNHMQLLCLSVQLSLLVYEDGVLDPGSIIPLIDGGTEGFKGNVRVILPGMTACIDCTLELYPPQVRGSLFLFFFFLNKLMYNLVALQKTVPGQLVVKIHLSL